MASQAAVYVQAIAMLRERAAEVSRQLDGRPDDAALQAEQVSIVRSLRLFRTRLRRTEHAGAKGVSLRGRGAIGE